MEKSIFLRIFVVLAWGGFLLAPPNASAQSFPRIDSFSPAFPEQFTDISYGPPAAGGPPVFFQASEPHLALQNETGGLQSTSAALVGFSIDYPAQKVI